MENDKIINLKTLEILNDNSEYIIVDSLIANTIVTLNKKGYKTENSCSGHFYEFTKGLQSNVNLDFLDEAKNSDKYSIDEIRNDNFDCWVTHNTTSIYIMFDKKYNFLDLPEGFRLENDRTIRCTIHFYNSNNKRKNIDDIHSEIEKYNKILEDWANNLPDIN